MLRWLDLVAILLAIGAVAVSVRVLGAMGESGAAPRRRGREIALLAGGTAVVTGILMAFVSTQSSDLSTSDWIDTTWTTLTSTPWGHLWLAREIALAIAAVACPCGPSVDGHRPASMVGLVALLAAVWFEGWAGHAAALPSRTLPAIFVAAVHIVAAGVWAGGLIALALCLVPLGRRDPQRRGPILTSAWRAFSPMAALAAVVLLASGLVETGLHVTGLHSIVSTLWGARPDGEGRTPRAGSRFRRDQHDAGQPRDRWLGRAACCAAAQAGFRSRRGASVSWLGSRHSC